MKKTHLAGLVAIVVCLSVSLLGEQQRAAAAPPKSSGYHLARTVPVGGDTYWDYLTVDDEARRVYITHWTHVVVMAPIHTR